MNISAHEMTVLITAHDIPVTGSAAVRTVYCDSADYTEHYAVDIPFSLTAAD